MVYRAAATLSYASHFALSVKGPTDLEWRQARLVKVTVRFMQVQCERQPEPGVNDYRQGVVGLCASLLLINWLHFTDPESEVRKTGKKEIAEHPDVLKVLQILQQLVESPDPSVARNARDGFVALVRLLTCEHARPLPDGTVETAFRFMGDPSIKQSVGHWMFVMTRNFRAGTLTADFLLAHFFPGFLRAFAADALRRKPARVYNPELEFLVGMVVFLHDCLWFSTPPGKPKRTEKPPYGQIAIPPKLLPKLLDVMLDTGAVAAVASLTGSACYRFAGKVCLGLANVAARGSSSKLRRFHEQIIPALMSTILEGYQDDEVVRFFRMGLLPYCTNVVAPSMPNFQLALAIPQKSGSNGVLVSYNWGENVVYIDGADSQEKKKVLQQVTGDLQPCSVVADDIAKDEGRRLALYYKHRQVVFNDGPAGESVQELLMAQHPGERCPVCKMLFGSVKPRCSRCRAKNYCSVACQTKDRPEHKNTCKKS
ncbi:hypothetical protein KFL_001610230 [Klebsormidium nitens]|uniref:MYND-type domain-containing protein n=1 Tax=Klebsormidium nitens TaxID=105231 RepID=A0A1Y1I1E5_KLENI|nr:hypothetical protein KFL_001610230 [Klebsormidium nitens]|eukprot:GAQ83782.1 hypothetical protein KFL_001610230 [Klebsormidium nitens]